MSSSSDSYSFNGPAQLILCGKCSMKCSIAWFPCDSTAFLLNLFCSINTKQTLKRNKLSPHWSTRVAELVFAELVCRRLDCRRDGLSPRWLVTDVQLIKLLTVSGHAEEISSRIRSVLWTIKYFSDYCIQARFYINQESTTRFVKIPVMAWETISLRQNGIGEGQAREKRERKGRTPEWLDMVTSSELNFWMFIVISGT